MGSNLELKWFHLQILRMTATDKFGPFRLLEHSHGIIFFENVIKPIASYITEFAILQFRE